MNCGEGNWIVVIYLPNLANQIVARYHLRSEAEHHARKLKRMLGDRYSVEAVFDLQATETN